MPKKVGMQDVFGDADADEGGADTDPMTDFRELAAEVLPDVDADKLWELIRLCVEAGYGE